MWEMVDNVKLRVDGSSGVLFPRKSFTSFQLCISFMALLHKSFSYFNFRDVHVLFVTLPKN